jgi:asparagine synthase (glutamine-hydrolysing)
MCGINGIIVRKGGLDVSAVIANMNRSLAHRGPDDEGVWLYKNNGLGHRRLSIIDLSSAGRQPMQSVDGRYVIVYNGELYNYRELKFDLQRAEHNDQNKPYIFSTNTDTEVVLASFLRWGVDCLQRFNGMFAFAIYDKQNEHYFIARDRMGVKPLYYYADGDHFLFSSEIRPLLQSGLVPKKLNKNALFDYVQYQTVHAPQTIVNNVNVLMPGHYMMVGENKTEIKSYWKVADVQSNLIDSYDYAKKNVRDLFFKAVERRLVADVPFGVFLSGGIDSSAVVAAMADVSSVTINTFSITFDDKAFNESHYSALVAKQYNTKHHPIQLTSNYFLEELPNALAAMDHPGGDGPNTYVVAKAARNAGITMALSGIGGDELFAGYDVFQRQLKIQQMNCLQVLPSFLTSSAAYINYLLKSDNTSRKMYEILKSGSLDFKNTYPFSRMVLLTNDVQKLINYKTENQNRFHHLLERVAPKNGVITQTSIAEIQTYLQNVLLRDTDQMSMANALEVREPFLDYKLVEYVLSLPDSYKYSPSIPKKLLTEALSEYLPKEIVFRKKMGFTFPWQLWMKGDLKELCETSLAYYKTYSVFNYEAINLFWQRFLNNDKQITWSRMWHLIVLANWLKQNEIEE